ncbi:MAG TPA: hypothetical protein VE570_06775, partial [Thermoleophilaceae bacterium]|nr:hypothetical protein [Thermoleophilaceae bacterium]
MRGRRAHRRARPNRRRIVLRQLGAIAILAVLVGAGIAFVRSRAGGDPAATTLRLPAATGGGDG